MWIKLIFCICLCSRLNRKKKEQADMAHVQRLLEEEKLRELAAARQRTENTSGYVGVGPKSTPSPRKKKLPRPKEQSDKQIKLPRLDFSGKNSKNVRNINSGRGSGKTPQESLTGEGNEVHCVVDFISLLTLHRFVIFYLCCYRTIMLL
jgi:hypothetical protein